MSLHPVRRSQRCRTAGGYRDTLYRYTEEERIDFGCDASSSSSSDDSSDSDVNDHEYLGGRNGVSSSSDTETELSSDTLSESNEYNDMADLSVDSDDEAERSIMEKYRDAKKFYKNRDGDDETEEYKFSRIIRDALKNQKELRIAEPKPIKTNRVDVARRLNFDAYVNDRETEVDRPLKKAKNEHPTIENADVC